MSKISRYMKYLSPVDGLNDANLGQTPDESGNIVHIQTSKKNMISLLLGGATPQASFMDPRTYDVLDASLQNLLKHEKPPLWFKLMYGGVTFFDIVTSRQIEIWTDATNTSVQKSDGISEVPLGVVEVYTNG